VSPSKIRAAAVLQKTAQVEAMLLGLEGLPLASLEAFASDPRNPAAAESYLRRALEALLDLGRHMLAKGFGQGPAEYKEIATRLADVGVLDRAQGALLTELAGYRNRLVHFYDEVSASELYDICSGQLDDIRRLLQALLAWARQHPEMIDGAL
jgi:uncharacterized protein YutE (UPF0331/DUF86 family)